MGNSAGELRSAVEAALAAADRDHLCPTLQMGILSHQLALLVAGQPHEGADFDKLLGRVLTSLESAARAERAEQASNACSRLSVFS